MKHLAIGLFAISAFCFACLGLTPAEQREIGDTSTIIANCQKLGRDCAADGGAKCYDAYAACMRDGGL